MTEPTPRQVLYALVAGGFIAVVAVLVLGAAMAGVVPTWWTWVTGVMTALVALFAGIGWRRTGPVLMASIGLFLVWTVGTLIVT